MASLESLPPEIFRSICSYLRASDLVSLKNAGPKFDSWLRPSYWKGRLLSQCNGCFPCLSTEQVDWIKASIDREVYLDLFGGGDPEHHQCTWPRASAYGIDAMHIVYVPSTPSGILIVGDRGRVVTGLQLTDHLEKSSWKTLFTESRMHSGWIWTIESYETTVVTGCWDGNLRSWALSATGLSPLATYQLRAPVLCSAFLNSHLLVVGAQQSVYLIDLRTPSDQPPALCMRHKKAVLCLDAFGNASGNSSIEWDVNACPVLPDGDQTLSTYDSYSSLSSIAASDGVADFPMDPITLFTDGSEAKKEIDPVEQITEDLGKSSATCTRVTDHPINENQPESGDAPPQTSNSTSSTNLFTGSSDHTLAGWDLRNPSTPAIKHRFTTYPRKISLLDNGELWVAEPPGRIHVFDTRQGNLQLVHTNELPGWNRGFGGLKAVPGCVFASGLHGTVEAFHPTRPLIPMGSKPVAEKIKASPTCLTARAGLLAVGSGDGSVYIWTTKRKTAEES